MCVRGGLHRLDVALSLAGMVVLMVAWTSKRLCSVSTEEVGDTRANINTLAVTSSGSIQGHVIQSHTGGAVVEYLGIPYALPPIGDRRYADPETYQKLPENFTASDMMASCVQRRDLDQFDPATWTPSNAESEDCLYLNIWVPQTSKTNLPTMVWIYGGGFYSGSSSLSIYNGTTLASYGEVIVVTFNYRVGSLGFLSTGDGRITGNFGLKDQVLALKWVHDHISSFGGSADKVTLFGESSGASSVGLHMMSPMSQQYFHRAILQSGAPNCHWAFMNQELARISSQNFIKDVKCEQHDDILKCLRQLDTTTILQEEWKTPEEYLNFAWVPTVDGQFLLDDPRKILSSGEFAKDKDVLAGVNCQEGSIWLTALPSFDKATDSLQTAEQFNEAVQLMTSDLTSYLQGRIHRAYQPGDVNNRRYNRNNLDLLSGDRSFTCPTRYFMSTLLQHDQSEESPEGSPDARGQPSRYFYRFCHRASTDRMADWMGVTHGAEIQWIFGEPLDRLREFTQEELKLSKVLMSYWAHFAETGNPNIANLPFWEPFTSDSPKHLSVSDPVTLTMSNRGFRDLLCNIWNDIDQEA